MSIQPEIIQALSSRLSNIYLGASFDFNVARVTRVGPISDSVIGRMKT